MAEDDDNGFIQNVVEGAVPGAAFGFLVGSTRAYLGALEAGQKTAAVEALRASARPPPPKVLRAMLPTPPIQIVASSTAMFTAVGGIYMGTTKLAAGLRGKNDLFNGAIAGIAAGSVVGLRKGSLRTSLMASGAFALGSLFVDIFGGFDTVRDDTTRRRKAVYGLIED